MKPLPSPNAKRADEMPWNETKWSEWALGKVDMDHRETIARAMTPVPRKVPRLWGGSHKRTPPEIIAAARELYSSSDRTQWSVARELGISQSQVSRAVRGEI